MKANTKELQTFIDTWQNKGDEVADKDTYWNTLLRILGVPQEQIDNNTFIKYEKKIKLRENEHFIGSIDAYIPSTKVLVEQKSFGVDLFKPELRPNGGDTKPITPYQQARRYDNHLSHNEKANFLVLCNFSQIVIYDVRESIDVKPVVIELKDLKKDLYLLDFLVKPDETKRIRREEKVSFAAGALVAKIYDELLNIFSNYRQLDEEKVRHSINTLCVRLVFCLYAEDAGLFGEKEQFYNYLKPVEPNRCGVALQALFKTLDTKDRTKDDPFWEAENPILSKFPYTNGGLFHEQDVIIPPFTEKLKHIVLDEASREFNWSAISPAIFGSVFESTLNPSTRRQGGMHYTSVKNIHKVIDPLFLNDLKAELEQIKQYKNQKTIREKAIAFQKKLSNLTFFDPAVGSGNFLTETFLSLRRLENEAIRLRTGGESLLDVGQVDDWIMVKINQFYGIEINDFAVAVAKTAMWIAQDQMQKETQDLLYANDWHFLPLETNAQIHEGNALRMDWNKVLPSYACHYLISNPPFSGARMMSSSQKDDLKKFCGNIKGIGNLDYVSGWYFKASQYIQNTKAKVCFVSTNSITQGEQVPILWHNLMVKYKIVINFAYRTFVWNSEAKDKAHVHVVIIEFELANSSKKIIYDENGNPRIVKEINGYLLEAPNIVINNTVKCISPDAPEARSGNQPIDDGNYLFDEEQYKEFIRREPLSKKYFRKWIGSREFIHRTYRYCLWLGNAQPDELNKMPLVLDRIKKVRQFRLNSKRKSTQKMADFPTHFQVETILDSNYLIMPLTSSQRRNYVPIGFITPDYLASNLVTVTPHADLYDFGIITSSVFMSWMRAIGGRLKSDYRITKNNVYNNFPWANANDKQKAKIKETAQAILDARAKYPNSSFADLYNPLTMPADLRKAHQLNDKAVLQAYGLKTDASEQDIVAHLFKMYEDLTKNKD